MAIQAKSLGFIAVTTAGTPVRLAATPTPCNYISIQPRKNLTTANTGNLYVMTGTGTGGAASNATLVFSILATGASPLVLTINNVGCDQLDLSLWYLDAATSADGALVSYY